jgi:hypothetical protein
MDTPHVMEVSLRHAAPFAVTGRSHVETEIRSVGNQSLTSLFLKS